MGRPESKASLLGLIVLSAAALSCGPGMAEVRGGEALPEAVAEPAAPVSDPVPEVVSVPAPQACAEPEDDEPVPGPDYDSATGLRRLTFKTFSGETEFLEYRPQGHSVGSPNRGGLVKGVCLPPSGPGFVHGHSSHYATAETIAVLMHGIGKVLLAYPNTAPAVIGSLSNQNGGRLRPHKSHRSGRDIDIAYFTKGNREVKNYDEVKEFGIDFKKNWHLISSMIETGRVQMIFMHRTLIPGFYQAASAAGLDGRELQRVFGGSKDGSSKEGIIRRARGHNKHFHVRMACPVGDSKCVDWAVKVAKKKGKHSKAKPPKKNQKDFKRPRS